MVSARFRPAFQLTQAGCLHHKSCKFSHTARPNERPMDRFLNRLPEWPISPAKPSFENLEVPILGFENPCGYAGQVTGSANERFALGFRRLHCVLVLIFVALASVEARTGFAWGPEGHKTVAILAVRYLRPDALAQIRELLGSESMQEASLWADDVAHSSRTETAPWHYIDIPLSDSRINLNRDCPQGRCVLVKTEEFLAVLPNPRTTRESRREALKFVLHFIADLHQPLHCEDNHDRGGNAQDVVFQNHPDNLHWVWDTGLVQEIDPEPHRLAAVLAREITDSRRAAWDQGSIRDWVLESHRLAQTVAYAHLRLAETPAIDRAYDQHAKAVVKLQLEKASVRLAYVLNMRLGSLEVRNPSSY